MSIVRFFALNARHSAGYQDGLHLERGEILISQADLSIETGLSRKQIRTAIDRLEGLHFLSKKKGQEGAKQGAKQGAKGATVYLIENYDSWDASLKNGAKQGAKPTDDEGPRGGQAPYKDDKEGKEGKGKDIAQSARENRVVHSVNPADDFTPDPAFSPNAIMTDWRQAKMPLPRSINELEQENGLRRLHHEPPHWSVEEIHRALDILRADFQSGHEQLRWVWKNGPGYLVRKKPDLPQVIEQVLEWKPFTSRPITEPETDSNDDLRTMYLKKRNRT